MATKGATRKGVSKGTRKKPGPRTKTTEIVVADRPLANPQHERFACEYIKDFNGTQAYLRTYQGVTDGAAKTNGSRLLTNADVRQRVEYLARQTLAAEKTSAQQVLGGLVRIAALDPRRAFDAEGALLPVHLLPDDVALAIAGVEVVEKVKSMGRGKKKQLLTTFTKKVKFNDRLGALGKLGEYLKMFGAGANDPPPADEGAKVTREHVEEARTRLKRLGAPVTIEHVA
jgi:phage terminase small subunit